LKKSTKVIKLKILFEAALSEQERPEQKGGGSRRFSRSQLPAFEQ
jgi:hypothetical protein